MNTIHSIHHDFGYTVIIINALAGIFTLIGLKVRAISRWKYYLYGAYAGWIAMLIQVVLGIVLFSSGDYDDVPKFHIFYGFVGLISVGLIFAYRKSLGKRKAMWIGIFALFLAGVGVRAIMQVV
jgi:hypothetical protein